MSSSPAAGKKVLLFGVGLSTPPMIHYLTSFGIQVTACARNLKKIEKVGSRGLTGRCKGRPPLEIATVAFHSMCVESNQTASASRAAENGVCSPTWSLGERPPNCDDVVAALMTNSPIRWGRS